jgi:hypothetical protein
MSDLNQIHTALERLFHNEGQRIVFWHDPNWRFLITLSFVLLAGAPIRGSTSQLGELQNTGLTSLLTLPSFMALCSAVAALAGSRESLKASC